MLDLGGRSVADRYATWGNFPAWLGANLSGAIRWGI